MKRFAIISNQSSSLLNFWKTLIVKIRQKGFDVVCLVPKGDEKAERDLIDLGAKISHFNLDRKGINPIRDLRTFLELIKILGHIKPDILFATTIKPVIYGCMAARISRIPCVFAMITGLGYAFENDTQLKKIINRLCCLLYRKSLESVRGVFFQNQDDESLFRKESILSQNMQVFFANGTGVDTRKFSPVPFPSQGRIKFLLIGRLLEAKGIREYARASEILRKKYPETDFYILGQPEQGRGSVSINEVKKWNAVTYLGQTDDVASFIAKVHVVALPSWREGLPTVIMEAQSMGRPCVVTDVPGCRALIKDGENGFLAEAKNPDSLAACMEKFIINKNLIELMGEAGRKKILAEYDVLKVTDGIIHDMLTNCPGICEASNDKRL